MGQWSRRTEPRVSGPRSTRAADNTGSWEASRRQGRLPSWGCQREHSPADTSVWVFRPPGGGEERHFCWVRLPSFWQFVMTT